VIVGAMVVFKCGEPFKSGYRRFKVKSLTSQDDYGSMREVISRRFRNYINQRSNVDGGTNFKETPDLVLIDGGKQHVAVVKKVLDDMQLEIAVAGLVKDEKHKTKALVVGKQELEFKNNELYKMVVKMQEEAHRFAIGYAHKLHEKMLYEHRKRRHE
jgi:excinuclease ABC subunit C